MVWPPPPETDSLRSAPHNPPATNPPGTTDRRFIASDPPPEPTWIAILIGGEIITIHDVRTVIRGRRVQITYCDDDAWSVLLRKLTD
ncbi:MAG: hypothetical protein GF346_06235 [Candidatus Eisenbacteria bacterium]|nr:hypothetical protein [Candidatus Latescibacterota bacterium]MBD3302024.1 hypothetical protein [Candidatus Eisenbacteria bacterium]